MRQFFVVLSLVLPAGLFAQNSDPVEIGAGTGIALYNGDLGSSDTRLSVYDPSFAFSTHLRRNLGNHVALRLNILAGMLKGNDKTFSTPEWRETRGMSFSSPLIEFSLLGEVYPLGLFSGRSGNDSKGGNNNHAVSRKRIAPYFLVGIGTAFRNPRVDWNEKSDNNGVNPERAALDKAAKIRGASVVVPFGGGIRFALNDQLTLGLEGALRPAFSDYLDGVSEAGNPAKNDWFFTGGLTLSYAIREPKPKVNAIPPAPNFAQKTKVDMIKADRDKDGVLDENDDCPDEPGSRPMVGCPDSDHDNVPDKDDKCPDHAGVTATGGCPDADGDGIADKDDGCPSIAGAAGKNGCPESAVGVPDLEFRSVFFATSKQRWYSASTATLNEVADILKNNPHVCVRIEGHTDQTGNGPANFVLSEQRAKNCIDYLVSKGISAGRMRLVGFGADRPATTNASPQGRKLNRRVEVYFTY